MKKLVTILMIWVYLISGTEFNQLLKLPSLVHHFQEHKALKSEITLWEFISLHYASGNLIDADHEKDEQLPFKSHEGCSGINELASLTNIHLVIAKPDFREATTFCNYVEQFLPSAYLNCIWQPPKTA